MLPLPMPGARLRADESCEFRVWAPYAEAVQVEVLKDGGPERREALARDGWGYHSGVLGGLRAGAQYRLVLDGERVRPDPASCWQPLGVHGPSAVVSPDFPWTDGAWRNPPLDRYVIYELHVGTFSPEGTFDGVLPYLGYLQDLGVTAIELMPVAQFPGSRNWGYDGVLPFAAQDSYGGPDGLRRLVDTCHKAGLAVVLDVVYNHLGPEGNYLSDFGPYFTDRYRTPWGGALNFDGADCDHVRNYFVQNAIYWTRDCHIDALRLDAVHAILDHAAVPFVEELGIRVHEAARLGGRAVYLIAESSDNDTRLITPREQNGYGMDAQWSDDFHHAVHTLLTGEQGGYYQDFGSLDHLAKAYREGFVYTGEYSPYRRRCHGSSSAHLPGGRFVVCVQNHDQVGNRLLGERLGGLAPLEAQKLAAASMLLAPYVPLLFMGEEYGETAPFQYFVSHTDPELVGAVRRGRKEEFADFGWAEEPPDPQAEETFAACKLDHRLRHSGHHAELFAWYRALLALRRSVPALESLDKREQTVDVVGQALVVRRRYGGSEAVMFFNFGADGTEVEANVPTGQWKRALDSAGSDDRASDGELESSGRVLLPLAPYQAVAFVKE